MLFASSSNSTGPSSSSTTSTADPSSTALPTDGKEQGAVGKVVRLPENVRAEPQNLRSLLIHRQCGSSPFARISKAWTPTNQSIPQNVARRLAARAAGGGTPVVRALSVDVDFGANDARYAIAILDRSFENFFFIDTDPSTLPWLEPTLPEPLPEVI